MTVERTTGTAAPANGEAYAVRIHPRQIKGIMALLAVIGVVVNTSMWIVSKVYDAGQRSKEQAVINAQVQRLEAVTSEQSRELANLGLEMRNLNQTLMALSREVRDTGEEAEDARAATARLIQEYNRRFPMDGPPRR